MKGSIGTQMRSDATPSPQRPGLTVLVGVRKRSTRQARASSWPITETRTVAGSQSGTVSQPGMRATKAKCTIAASIDDIRGPPIA